MFDPPAGVEAQTPREWFFRLWRLRRLPDHRIEGKWLEWCKANSTDIPQ